MIPKFKDPGPRQRTGTILKDAAKMALRNPGRWVLAQKYKNARSASGVAYEYRHRYPELEITTRDNELYMRSPAPETKETK